MAEGVVAGGGVALLRASESLDKMANKLSDEEAVGVRIVRDALAIPARQIAENAGEDGSVVVSIILLFSYHYLFTLIIKIICKSFIHKTI